MPRVTVALLCWNQAQFVSECFNGLEEQTFRDFEVVVVDNGSRDGSPEILQELASRSALTVRLILLEENIGIGGALNRILGMANSEYFLPFAADDVMLAHRLAHQVEVFSELPSDFAVLGSSVKLFGDAANVGRILKPDVRIMNGHDRRALLRGGRPPAPGAIVRIEALQAIGGYDARAPFEDYDTWLRLAFNLRKRIWGDGEVVSLYRQHGGNISADSHLMRAGELYSLLRLEGVTLSRDERREWYRTLDRLIRPPTNWRQLLASLQEADSRGVRRLALRALAERGLGVGQRSRAVLAALSPRLATKRVRSHMA